MIPINTGYSSRLVEVEVIAEDLLSQIFGIKLELPIKLESIAKFLDLTILIGDFQDEQIDGVFERSTKRIVVSSSAPQVRKRFTVAHEIGHFVLHSEMDKEIFFRSKSRNISMEMDNIEREANAFAAIILMPRDLTISQWRVTRNLSVLASRFGVSKEAMQYRLKGLGITVPRWAI